MTIPVPDPANPPGVAELEARRDHAYALRETQPGITDRQILDAWDRLGAANRSVRLLVAYRAILERATKPGVPDDPDRLRARLGDAR